MYARDEAALRTFIRGFGKPVRMPDSALTGLSRSDEETKQNSRRDSGFLSVLPAVLRRERIDKVWVLVIIQVDEAENYAVLRAGNRDSGPVLSFFPNRFGGEMNMEQWKRLMRYFSRSEKLLWGGSVGLILAAFLLFDRGNYLTLTASLIGVTALIFVAKANPFGQFLVIVFSVLYGIISYSFAYYGEMITYLGMTLPWRSFR